MIWTTDRLPTPAQQRKRRERSHGLSCKWWCSVAVATLLLVALGTAWPSTRSLLRAISIAYRFSDSHPLPMRMYWRLTAREIEQSVVVIPTGSGTLRARSFSPRGVENPPVFVVVHGFVRDGMNDPPTSTIATELATDGFRVLVPNIGSEQEMLIEPAAVREIGDVARWARLESGRPVVLMGVSFGGGLALRAASMPEYADDIRVTFCVGAFNDMERLSAFYTGASAVGPDGTVDRTKPANVGGPVMAMQHLDELIPPGDVPAMRDLLHSLLMVEAGMPVVQKKLAGLPPRLQDEFAILMTTTGEQGRRYMKMWERHRAVYDEISPHTHLAGVSSEVFLLHGSSDPLVSQAEARWNAYELAAAGKRVHLGLSPYLLHWDMQKGTPIRGKLEIALFLAKVLRAAGA